MGGGSAADDDAEGAKIAPRTSKGRRRDFRDKYRIRSVRRSFEVEPTVDQSAWSNQQARGYSSSLGSGKKGNSLRISVAVG